MMKPIRGRDVEVTNGDFLKEGSVVGWYPRMGYGWRVYGEYQVDVINGHVVLYCANCQAVHANAENLARDRDDDLYGVCEGNCWKARNLPEGTVAW